jgi:small-conductance mechanosensitive channel
LARRQPLLVLFVLLVALLGASLVAEAGVSAGKLQPTRFVAGLAGLVVPVAIALGGTVAFAFLFRAAGRRLERQEGALALRSLAALQTAAVIVVVVFLVGATFGNFTGTLLSLGLVGFGLTLALQRPILALGGWCAIIFAKLFRVGDRIEVADLAGDVLEIRLFTTRLWEVDRATQRATGRLLSVNNGLFLEKPVANATADVRHVFDEFVVTVAFGSDVQAADALLRRVGARVLEPSEQAGAADAYASSTQGLPIETTFPREPVVLVGLVEQGVELRLRYLADARRRSQLRTALAEAWLAALGEHAKDAVPRIGPERA